MTDPGRWDTITGSAHTIVDTPEDRDRYPWLVPGDVVLELAAYSTAGMRVRHRIIVTGEALDRASIDLYAYTLDRMTRDLDQAAPIR